MYCPRCHEPNLSGDICVKCLTDKEYREIYGKDKGGYMKCQTVDIDVDGNETILESYESHDVEFEWGIFKPSVR